MNFLFFANSALLGVGLAMDAFSVSLADGLREPGMKKGKMCLIAGVFGFFQALMPLLGWACIHTIVEKFRAFEAFVPWIALLLLCLIGGKMIFESTRRREEAQPQAVKTGLFGLLLQGVATSIDALSVGFTIAEYDLAAALVCALIVAAVTFGICLAGLFIGRKVGTRYERRAGFLGGIILILIGIEIVVSSFL